MFFLSFSLQISEKNVLFFILCIFSNFYLKKRIKKEDYFMLFYMRVTTLLSPLQLIVGTSNSLKKRAKVFVMNLNTEKKNHK